MRSASPSGGAIPESESHPAPGTSGAPTWYVLETKRHREQTAQAFLAQREFETYLPRTEQWPRPVVGGDIAPLFPGYLFVRACLPEDLYRVTWTPGVKTLVSCGETPLPVDAEIIAFLRGREGADGVIRCGAGTVETSEVRIVNGPFRGLTAVVEQRLPARERVRVLMHLLQRETRVELPERWVRLA